MDKNELKEKEITPSASIKIDKYNGKHGNEQYVLTKDGAKIISAVQFNKIVTIDANSMEKLDSFKFEDREVVFQISSTDDGKYLLIGVQDGKDYLYDLTQSSSVPMESDEKSITVSPNPSKYEIGVTVEDKSLKVFGYTICDIDGKELRGYQEIEASESFTIPAHKMPAGAYIVSFKTNKGLISIKIQIER
jgi:hypothetical protein